MIITTNSITIGLLVSVTCSDNINIITSSIIMMMLASDRVVIINNTIIVKTVSNITIHIISMIDISGVILLVVMLLWRLWLLLVSL